MSLVLVLPPSAKKNIIGTTLRDLACVSPANSAWSKSRDGGTPHPLSGRSSSRPCLRRLARREQGMFGLGLGRGAEMRGAWRDPLSGAIPSFTDH